MLRFVEQLFWSTKWQTLEMRQSSRSGAFFCELVYVLFGGDQSGQVFYIPSALVLFASYVPIGKPATKRPKILAGRGTSPNINVQAAPLLDYWQYLTLVDDVFASLFVVMESSSYKDPREAVVVEGTLQCLDGLCYISKTRVGKWSGSLIDVLQTQLSLQALDILHSQGTHNVS